MTEAVTEMPTETPTEAPTETPTEAVSEPLPLNHANDLTYNSKRGVFVAVHNNPYRKWVSLIDPETLTVIETVIMDVKIYSISYNETREQYVVGLSGGADLPLPGRRLPARG